MHHLKKVVFFLIVGIVGFVITGFALDMTLKQRGGLGSLAKSLEAMKLRSAHPGMPPAEIDRLSANAPQTLQGLIKGLSSKDLQGNGAKELHLDPSDDPNLSPEGADGRPLPKDTYIQVSQNPDAMLNPQLDENGQPLGKDQPKGAVQDLAPGTRMVQVSQTHDGREVIGTINDGGIGDPSAIDRIMNMNISDEMREKILKNYQETGVLPDILVKEKRKPAAAPKFDDDPYNKKNW